MARSIFLFSTFLTAVCVPHFDLLMGLTGSLTGALLSFIFPCIFHINIKKLKLEYYQVFFDIVILLMGTVCSVTGVYRSGKIRKTNDLVPFIGPGPVRSMDHIEPLCPWINWLWSVGPWFE